MPPEHSRDGVSVHGVQLDIAHGAHVKHQGADGLSRLPTKGTDDSDINDEIPIIAVAIHAEKRPTRLHNNVLEQADIEAKDLLLPTLVEVISRKVIDAY